MRIELGKFNQLEVVKEVDFGIILTEVRKVKFCCLLDMYRKLSNRRCIECISLSR